MINLAFYIAWILSRFPGITLKEPLFSLSHWHGCMLITYIVRGQKERRTFLARIIERIGSWETPLDQLEKLGALCRELGIWIRSGHTPGADYAFERGARDRTLLYLPYPNFHRVLEILTDRVVSLLPESGKNWRKGLDTSAVLRAYREITELFKEKLIDGMDRQHHYCSHFKIFGSGPQPVPVDAVVCWANVNGYGVAKGGTAQAVQIANAAGIPVLNLAKCEAGEVNNFLRDSI